MPKPRTSFQPLPHEPVRSLSENLRFVKAPIPGVPFDRTMSVVRLADGRLLIWNAIALDDASMKELEAWGEPALLIVPSALHRLDAPAFKARYPGLRVFGPSGARDAIAKVVPLDGTLEDAPVDASVSFHSVPGIGHKEGVMQVRSADGATLVFNDLLFNMDMPTALSARLLVGLFGSAPGPRVSRVVKVLWCKDRPALRGCFEQLSAVPDLQRVIVAHDTPLVGVAAREALRSAVSQLA